jgi:O-acetylhomoserine/O-acetylserine sulfhydrylase-like pyridoxal-dependent enzyme
MNERIAKLAKKAGIKMAHDETLALGYLNTAHKKFAELIIKECASVADDGFGSAHFGLGITGQDLKNHFDVK